MSHSRQFVIDTNIIVSALLFPKSVPHQAFTKAIRSGAILMSMSMLAELEEVLGRKRFDSYLLREERMEFLENLVINTQWIEISRSISMCRDPRDDKLLELAVNGQADCIITGDADLLVLHPFQGISILTPRQFLDEPFSHAP